MESTKAFLMAQNEFTVPSIIQSFTAVLNYFWCYLLVNHFNLSLRGVAIAKSITDLSNAITLITYIRLSKKYSKTWIAWDKESLQDWVPYLQTTSMIGANLYIEWIAYEASILIAGALHNEYIMGAHGLAMSLQSLAFTIPLGNSIAMQTFVGNAAGEGSKNKAQKVAFVGLVLNCIESSANTFFFLVFARNIAQFFTQEPRTVEILTNIIIIYGLAHHVDTYASHMGGILKTIGRERDVLIKFLSSYVIFGLSAEYIFGVLLGYGYLGIWFSLAASIYVMFGLMVKSMMDFNWDVAIRDVQRNIHNEKHVSDSYVEMKQVLISK